MPPTLIDALRGMSQWEAQDVLRRAATEALWRPLLDALSPEQAADVENAVYETARLAWQHGLATGVKLAQNRHAPAQLAAAAEALVKEKDIQITVRQRQDSAPAPVGERRRKSGQNSPSNASFPPPGPRRR